MDILEKMKKEMFRRKLSHRTMKTYLFYVRNFLLFCRKSSKEISKKDCREFLELFMVRKLSWTKKLDSEIAGATLNVALNSLRFMMEEVLRKSMRLNIRYSKIPKTLPVCLTKEEVHQILDVIVNPKHHLMIALMYGAGLRVSELVKLKHDDIELDFGFGWVRKGKGNKDRPFIIPRCLMENIQTQLNMHQVFLFPGRKGLHLSSRAVQAIVKTATRNAKVKKNVHPHTFRHSFATHLLEHGEDVVTVQSLLGHNESRTTMEYLHVVRPKLLSTKSPLDTI